MSDNRDTICLICDYLALPVKLCAALVSKQFSHIKITEPTIEMRRKKRLAALRESNPRFEIVKQLGLELFNNLGQKSFITPNIVATHEYNWSLSDLSRNHNFNYNALIEFAKTNNCKDLPNILDFAHNDNCTWETLMTKSFVIPRSNGIFVPYQGDSEDKIRVELEFSTNRNYPYEIRKMRKVYPGFALHCSLDIFKQYIVTQDPTTIRYKLLWKYFSKNRNCTREFALENSEHINLKALSHVVNADIFTDTINWDKYGISSNKNYKPEDLVNSKYYDSYGVCINPHITWEFVKAHGLEKKFIRVFNTAK